MARVAYLYFAHPSKVQLTNLFSEIERAGLAWSHLGFDDPPKKFVGEVDETINTLCHGPDTTNYAFARIAKGDATLTFCIRKDSETWPQSSLSVSSTSFELVDQIVGVGLRVFEIYLAIQGRTDRGKNQEWTVIERSNQCPQDLLEQAGL